MRPDRGKTRYAAWLAAAAGVVAALALVRGAQRSALVQVHVSQSGKLLPVGGPNLGDSAISREPQRLKKLHQVDFHRMPSEHCPVGTPGCLKPAWSRQADHAVVLATDRRPRNYIYNYFTDEANAAKDMGQDRMVRYVHPPRQALSDHAGDTRDGEQRYKNQLGDNILDVPNNEGWQSGDIHMAMDGHDRMPMSHIYKVKRPTTVLNTVVKAPNLGKFEAAQAQLHRSLYMSKAAPPAHNGAHTLFVKKLGVVAAPRHAAVHKTHKQVQTFVVSGEHGKVLKGKAAKGAHRVQRKHYFGSSSSSASNDLDSYFDKLNLQQQAAHTEAMFGAHHMLRA